MKSAQAAARRRLTEGATSRASHKAWANARTAAQESAACAIWVMTSNAGLAIWAMEKSDANDKRCVDAV
jgi:hypothetical protein